MNDYEFGTHITDDGVVFKLWAPAARKVDIVTDRICAMERAYDGWFRLKLRDASAGTLYKFRIDGKLEIPDPASRFQPSDVAGPSEVIDHREYKWQAGEWRGRPWEDAVFLECHVGAFTTRGNYLAMVTKLDHLASTGITALELMPLADFPGRWSWGYDGVLWYAPDSIYGRPDDLKVLIDEAHLRGMMVFLDVVYNHFGPEGNYVGQYAPAFFSASETPWGNAIDYRVPEVRRFAIENALYWLREYRFDGLRLDAVHAIVDTGQPHLLEELSLAVGQFAKISERQIHLVLENDDNATSLLDPSTNPSQGKYRAQWNDDYHHAWHVFLTKETHGYYGDYQAPVEQIARILSSGFAYQGEPSAHRDGALRGQPSGGLPPTGFVNFLQNHDQIGNRAFGDRLESGVDPSAIEAALAITLMSPFSPLMFMGEEWGATAPFPFFCDFSGNLAEAVRQGRRKEFHEAYEAHGDGIPDPLNETTFKSACLDWQSIAQPTAQKRLQLVRDLLAVRRAEVVPYLAGSSFDRAAVQDGLLTASWILGDGRTLFLSANLSNEEIEPPPRFPAKIIWGNRARVRHAPWAVLWAVGD